MTAKEKEQRIELLKRERDFLSLVLRETEAARERLQVKVDQLEYEMAELMTAPKKKGKA
jgi:hypothetical protein